MVSGWNAYIEALPSEVELKTFEEKTTNEKFTWVINEFKPTKVLEVGCSNGRWLRHMQSIANYDLSLHGLDIDPSGFLDKGINFTYGDAKELPYRGEVFDIVISLGLLEHFEKHERAKIIAEQLRVTKKGGIIYNQIPNVSKVSIEMYRIKLVYEKMLHAEYHYFFNPREIGKNMKKKCELIYEGYIGKFRDIEQLPTNRMMGPSYLCIGRKM